LAVAYDATRATRDLDAVFIPSDVVRQAAAAVAEREGLAEDWLNDQADGPGPTVIQATNHPLQVCGSEKLSGFRHPL